MVYNIPILVVPDPDGEPTLRLMPATEADGTIHWAWIGTLPQEPTPEFQAALVKPGYVDTRIRWFFDLYSAHFSSQEGPGQRPADGVWPVDPARGTWA